jgi:DNA polymerase-3 subunit epsilon
MRNFINSIFKKRTKTELSKSSTETSYSSDNDVPSQDQLARDFVSKVPNGTYRFIALDVETANRNNFSICQIGLACVRQDNSIESYDQLIFTDEVFGDFNVELHGIDEDTVKDSPSFGVVIQSLRQLLERHVIIQHSNFDKQAINMACRYYELPTLRSDWVDSVRIARKAWPEFIGNGGHSLKHLKNKLDLRFKHHDAAEDARAAAEIILLAENKLKTDFANINSQSSTGKKTYQKSPSMDGDQKGPLYGHIACFTGSLELSRTEASSLAAGAGITVRTGVSKKTTLLIVGEQDLTVLGGHSKSSKHRRAEELISEGLEIRIIGENDFKKLIST